MSYADLTYYKSTYLGEDPIDDTLLQKYLDRAADDIDMICGGPTDTSELYTAQIAYLKKANCAQAEYYVVNGETYNDLTSSGSVTIGKYSSNENASDNKLLSSRARNYLNMAGICNAAVNVRGRGAYCDECETY